MALSLSAPAADLNPSGTVIVDQYTGLYDAQGRRRTQGVRDAATAQVVTRTVTVGK